MLNKNIIDEINSKVSDILQNSPAKDVERNMRAALSGVFFRLDLVTRDEFDVQQNVLQRTREKLTQLEAKVSALEQQLGIENAAADTANAAGGTSAKTAAMSEQTDSGAQPQAQQPSSSTS